MSVSMIDAIEQHEEEMSILRVKQLELQREELGYMVLYCWRQYKHSALLAERHHLQCEMNMMKAIGEQIIANFE
jgi:hypothetical protein